MEYEESAKCHHGEGGGGCTTTGGATWSCVCCHVANSPKTRKCGFQSEIHYSQDHDGFRWGVYGADCIS